jgi:hypothetical protein
MEECGKCSKIGELMPKRKICRICYNEEKRIQRNDKYPTSREAECTKCFKVKKLPKGKKWCNECKNDYERERKSKLTGEKKKEINEKGKEYYQKIKEKANEVIFDKTEIKKCSICEEDKTLDKFYVAKCKGTIRSECKECASKFRKQHYLDNKKAIIKQNSDYQVKKCKIDPAFKIKKTLRCRLYHALRSQAAQKSNRTLKLTGCNIPYLMGYLAAKFTEGMTWENQGKWHIDHIKPCSKFNLLDEEEQKKCFHYTNLQPLWGIDNIIKGNKYEEVTSIETQETEEIINE